MATEADQPAPVPSRGRVLAEVGGLFLATCAAIRGLLAIDAVVGEGIAHDLILFAVALLFLYAPRAASWLTRWEPPTRIVLPDPLWPALRRSLVPFGLVVLAIYPAFLLGNHWWQTQGLSWVTGQLGLPRYLPHHPVWTRWPEDFLSIALYQLLCVGYAEEFFYRGYMQTRLDQVFPARRRILGAELGWSFLITAVLFTVGHSLVTFLWWQPFIFFPALVFGWLRARTGNVLAGTFFHAFANTAMITLDTIYGVR